MGVLLHDKLFQVSPVQGSLEEEGRSDLSTAQSKGVTTSEARLESLMWKARMTLSTSCKKVQSYSHLRPSTLKTTWHPLTLPRD